MQKDAEVVCIAVHAPRVAEFPQIVTDRTVAFQVFLGFGEEVALHPGSEFCTLRSDTRMALA